MQLKKDQVLTHELLLQNRYGRIREVAIGPDGTIYFSTSQHDPPEGQPQPGDYRIYRLLPVVGADAPAARTVKRDSVGH